MLRYALTVAIVLSLEFPSTGMAQAPQKPSFATRFQSFFGLKPKTEPAKVPARTPASTRPTALKKTVPAPTRVTTRSGSLRRPGPEPATPFTQKPTPTFAPPEEPLASQAPRPFPGTPAKKVPTTPVTPQKRVIRDSAMMPAGYQPAPVKKEKTGWFQSLWTRKKPATGTTHGGPSPMGNAVGGNSAMNRSSSIDPRRVYRGSQPIRDKQDTPSRFRSTNFSETGIPQSTSEFRGRRDSAF